MFLSVAVNDYMYDPEEKNGKKPCIKNKHVELMSKLFMYGLERQFKNFVQIICGYLMFRKFLPFWDVITTVCNQKVLISGDWGAENLFAVLTSILFWTFSPLYLHLLINSFVYGMLPKCLSHPKGPRHLVGLHPPRTWRYRCRNAEKAAQIDDQR